MVKIPEKLAPLPDLVRHVTDAMEELDLGVLSIEQLVIEFIATAREERKQARMRARAQANAAPGQRGNRVRTSPFILTGGIKKHSLQLDWVEVVYRAGKKQPIFKRVATRNGIAHWLKISKGAADAEIDVLRAHEMQAREIRKLWKRYVQTRRNVRTLLGGLNRAQDEGGESAAATGLDAPRTGPTRAPLLP